MLFIVIFPLVSGKWIFLVGVLDVPLKFKLAEAVSFQVRYRELCNFPLHPCSTYSFGALALIIGQKFVFSDERSQSRAC